MTDRRTVHIPAQITGSGCAATVSLARAPWEPQVTDHSETAPTGRVIRHDRPRRIFDGITLAHLHERGVEA